MKTVEKLSEQLSHIKWERGQLTVKLKDELALSKSLWGSISVHLSEKARYKVANMLAHHCLVHAITKEWDVVLTRSDYEKEGRYLIYRNDGEHEWVTHEDYGETK